MADHETVHQASLYCNAWPARGYELYELYNQNTLRPAELQQPVNYLASTCKIYRSGQGPTTQCQADQRNLDSLEALAGRRLRVNLMRWRLRADTMN